MFCFSIKTNKNKSHLVLFGMKAALILIINSMNSLILVKKTFGSDSVGKNMKDLLKKKEEDKEQMKSIKSVILCISLKIFYRVKQKKLQESTKGCFDNFWNGWKRYKKLSC